MYNGTHCTIRFELMRYVLSFSFFKIKNGWNHFEIKSTFAQSQNVTGFIPAIKMLANLLAADEGYIRSFETSCDLLLFHGIFRKISNLKYAFGLIDFIYTLIKNIRKISLMAQRDTKLDNKFKSLNKYFILDE